MNSLLKFIKSLWVKKVEPPKRRKVDNNAIRARLNAQGWKLLEIPIKKRDPKTKITQVLKWKVIATRVTKSVEVSGDTIDDALKNIGRMLGVISKE